MRFLIPPATLPQGDERFFSDNTRVFDHGDEESLRLRYPGSRLCRNLYFTHEVDTRAQATRFAMILIPRVPGDMCVRRTLKPSSCWLIEKISVSNGDAACLHRMLLSAQPEHVIYPTPRMSCASVKDTGSFSRWLNLQT